MSRPEFLTRPGSWVRSNRIAQTDAEYAAAIERYTREGTAGAVKWLGAGLAVVIVIAVAVRLGFLGG